MENPIQMDDLGVPLFLETSIYIRPFRRDHVTPFITIVGSKGPPCESHIPDAEWDWPIYLHLPPTNLGHSFR